MEEVSGLSSSAKAKIANGIPAIEEPLPVKRKQSLVSKLDPLPAIAIGLAIALVGGIYWQLHYGPLTNLPYTAGAKPVSQKPQLSDSQRAERQLALGTISNTIAKAEIGCAHGHELSDNWQYKAQSEGPDQFLKEVSAFRNDMWYAGEFDPTYTFKNFLAYPDLAPFFTTEWQFPSVLLSTTSALEQEINRIKEHKADLVFTLINNVKLLDWKNALPACDKWVAEKKVAIRNQRSKYDK